MVSKKETKLTFHALTVFKIFFHMLTLSLLGVNMRISVTEQKFKNCQGPLLGSKDASLSASFEARRISKADCKPVSFSFLFQIIIIMMSHALKIWSTIALTSAVVGELTYRDLQQTLSL